jgi:hypothetical protein
VSCITSTDCWAVGYYYADSAGDLSTLVEHGDGSTWSIASSPNMAGASSELLGVSCITSTEPSRVA